MKTAKLLLFDIDGTLLHTGGAGRIAFERVFEEIFGIRGAWGETIPDGKTDPLIIEEIAGRTLGRPLSGDEYAELCRRYLFHSRLEIKTSPRFRLLPGVPDLVRILSGEKDFFLGVATGNFEEAAWLKLEKGGLRSYFSFGGFGSDSADRLELTRAACARGEEKAGCPVPPQTIFIIGDTPHDVLAGKALGACTIAVTSGKMKADDFAACRPDYLLPDLSNTKRFLEIVKGRRRSMFFGEATPFGVASPPPARGM